MRFEVSVTSISWIPSEAMAGVTRIGVDIGMVHYDPPPPDRIDDALLDELLQQDRFRFANRSRAWIEIDDGDHRCRILRTGSRRFDGDEARRRLDGVSLPIRCFRLSPSLAAA